MPRPAPRSFPEPARGCWHRTWCAPCWSLPARRNGLETCTEIKISFRARRSLWVALRRGMRRASGDCLSAWTVVELLGGAQGVDNVYTQHEPLVQHTIENIMKGKAKDSDYPYVGPSLGPKDKPQDVIVFIVGGTTYEEARAVAALNAAAKKDGSNHRIILGGTAVLNSSDFVGSLRKLTDSADQLL